MIRDTSSMDEPLEAKRRSRFLQFGAAVGGILLIVLFARPTLQRWSRAEQSISESQLRFATVERGDLLHDLAVQGRIIAASRPTLFSPAAGTLHLHVREGERVAADAVLADLLSPELQSRLLQERATLDALQSDLGRLELSVRQRRLGNAQTVERIEVQEAAARREVQRAETLAEAGLINEIDLETARDALTVRKLELAQARQNVELEREMLSFELTDARRRMDRQRLIVTEQERRVAELQIRSPFDGLVATISVEDRDAVQQGQPLLGVVDLTDLEIEVAIPEAYADEVVAGVEALVKIDGIDHRAQVVRVAPEVRNSQVEGRIAFLDGTPDGLRQNQRVSTRLVLDHRTDVVKVRRGPFLESLGGRQVWTVSDGFASLRPVEIGAISVTEVEVLQGLEPGDRIILSDLSRYQGVENLFIRE